jgi:hypothetical protein
VRDTRFDKLKSLIKATFPEIHWEVWGVDNKARPERFQGGLDGWKYRAGLFQSEEGTCDEVVHALMAKLLDWYALKEPTKAGELAHAYAVGRLSEASP